jgi:hypothetical protein
MEFMLMLCELWPPPPPPPFAKAPLTDSVAAVSARAATVAVRMDFRVMLSSPIRYWRATIAADDRDRRDAPACGL